MCPGLCPGKLRRMWIRPPLLDQIVGAFSATGMVAIALLVFSDAGVPDVPLLPTAAAIALIAVFRAFRAGVYVRDDEVTVHGYVWSRTITRARIIKVRIEGFPAIVWRTEDGKQRTTPLIAFTFGTGNERRFEARVGPGLRRLQASIDQDGP